ncbi:MAG: glutaminase A [Candidatus Obscuribacterales bacterium]|nr:glutaminase A [Candidatus Obscuribacterales bacterium]
MSDNQDLLFRAYAVNSKVDKLSLIDTFAKSGILPTDPRAASLYRKLSYLGEKLGEEEFRDLHNCSPALFEKVLTGQLAIPQFSEFTNDLDSIFEQVSSCRDGKLADYIPQLARVNPEKFSMAVCSIDGQQHSLGDADDFFCVQSCSKPITYCLALEENGENIVHNYVGTEPSGKTFNELTLNSRGFPHNPMINAGAIMCGALIKRDCSASDRFDYVMGKWKELSGNMKVGFDNAVYLSERQTGDRNFALAYFMREKGAFPPDTELLDILDFYFQCCSIEVTSKAMSVIAATLANGGTCPLTGQQVFRPDHVKNCLSLMSSCGLYDFSGEFAFRVGIPGKSGVSGAIMLVVPNLLGLALWSPRLDELGNSVRGIEFCKKLAARFKMHAFDSMVGLKDNRIDPRRNIYESRHGGIVAFCTAALEGDLQEMRRLLANGLDPEMKDYSGRTALHLAASEGKMAVLQYLLELGVEINPVDSWGNTPLNDALRHKHLSIVSLLREHGAKQLAEQLELNKHTGE